jgi:arginine exporter protein ArgO
MRRPPPGYRRGARPLYPGVFKMLIYGFVLWGLALLGIHLPFQPPRLLLVALEVGVIWLLWRGVKAARRAPVNQVRLFNAQENWVNAFALQALILFLW